MGKLKTVYTYNNLNKKIFYWGLSGPQLLRISTILILLYVIVFLMVMFVLNGIYALIILVLVVMGSSLPVSKIVKEIRAENRKGNPDYLASKKVEKYSPGYMVDKSFVMSILKSNRE